MTEDADDAPLENIEVDQGTSALLRTSDFFLAQMVGLANDCDIELGITLTIGGAIISGQLMSGKRYFEEQAALMSGSGTVTEVSSAIAEVIRNWTALYDKPKDAPDDYTPPSPTFIHLRDALFIYPDGKVVPGNGGPLWRGKISSVDGFSFGMTRPRRE